MTFKRMTKSMFTGLRFRGWLFVWGWNVGFGSNKCWVVFSKMFGSTNKNLICFGIGERFKVARFTGKSLFRQGVSFALMNRYWCAQWTRKMLHVGK